MNYSYVAILVTVTQNVSNYFVQYQCVILPPRYVNVNEPVPDPDCASDEKYICHIVT